MRIFYVDDSGDEQLTTFSAISVPAERWIDALDCWLSWRRRLQREHGVDVQYRLHATDWVAGRGRPATSRTSVLDRSRSARWRTYVEALETLAREPSLRILTVLHEGTDRPAAYRLLMRRMNELLQAEERHGLVIMDGDSPELRTLHGELELASRRLIEDPWKRDARQS